MLFWGDPGTLGNVKVIAGDCQRLLEIVDNSTFNKNYNSHLTLPNRNRYFSEASSGFSMKK